MPKKIKWVDVGNGVRINAELVDEIRNDRIILNTGEIIFINEFDNNNKYFTDLYESYGRDD